MDVRNILRLGRLRLRFEKYMVAALQKQGYEGLAPAHGGVVSTLYAYGPMQMSELALSLEKRKPTVTTLVTKLEKNALVETKKDSYDKRVTRVHLTKAGRQFAQVTNKLAHELANEATEGLTKEQQEVFTEVLEELLHNTEVYR